MKKGVSYGRIIRNGFVFFLVFLMLIGSYGLYEEITKKDLENANPETIEVSSSPNEETFIDSEASESSSISETTINSVTEEPTSELEEQMSQETETFPEDLEATSPEETPEQDNTEEIINETENPQEELTGHGGTVCLTFDDGPSMEITNQILDVLQEKNVKATFFIIDYSSEKFPIISREIEEGHTVGIHGLSHDYSSIYSSLEALTSNFVTLQDKLYNDTGYYSNFIRFPGGSSNTVSKKYCTGIMSQATQSLSDMGFIYFDWNVDSDDAGSAKSSEDIYNNVISALIEGRTNVVLMHDASNKKYTLEALPAIIDYATQHGFEFQAISENTKIVQHNVNN